MLASARMRTLPLTLSLTLLLGLLPACRGPAEEASSGAAGGAAGTTASGAAIRLELPDAPAVGLAPLEVFLLEAGEGVSGAAVEILGTMNHAGMAPVVVVAEETEPGLYVAEDFAFTMAGDWIVTAEAVLPNGEELEDEATVTVAQP